MHFHYGRPTTVARKIIPVTGRILKDSFSETCPLSHMSAAQHPAPPGGAHLLTLPSMNDKIMDSIF